MKILAIESSAKAASIALCEDEHLIAESYQNQGLTHSRTLMPMCEDLLKNCGITLHQVDLIAVAAGPGSFTGLRIGLAAAKGLAWPEEKLCCGVSTLKAMAWNVAHVNGVVCCTMDARRQQVYTAKFRCEGGVPHRITEDAALSLEECFVDAEVPMLLVGDGAELSYRFAASRNIPVTMAPEHLRWQRAYGVAREALEQYRAGKATSAGELSAMYLRLSQAERERLAQGKSLTV